MRTLIYARYSSTLQNPRSIEDQLAACRARAAREGWTVLGEYHDQAISGAAGIKADQRPGLHALLARVEAGGIDQVLTESTDRMARHQGDAFAIREQMQYAGARLYTLLDGEVDEITGTIKGLFDARMRKDLAARVKRGAAGAIAQGRAPTGIAYGYRRVARFDARGEPIRGLREIDPDQAAIVRRIHEEYAAGESPYAIAGRLNAEGVPPPKRGVWRESVINGNKKSGFGILRNVIYIGVLAYGRTKGVTDPRTREKRFRPGDGNVLTAAAPELRIIDDALWQRVQAEIERRSFTRPEAQRRPKHVLSGLGVCGTCGANWIVTRLNNWGCSAAAGGQGCSNRRLISTRKYERAVLAELRREMLAPDVVTAYLREYHREHARQTAESGKHRDRVARRLDEAERKLRRLVDAVAAGAGEFAEFRDLLTAARSDRDGLARELAGIEALPVLTLHPGLADQYRRSIEDLAEAFAGEETRIEAMPRLRKLIARIVCTPADGPRGAVVRVVRQIDEILVIARSA